MYRLTMMWAMTEDIEVGRILFYLYKMLSNTKCFLNHKHSEQKDKLKVIEMKDLAG